MNKESESKPENDDPKATETPDTQKNNTTFAEKVQTSAKLAAAQANIEKLKRVNLRAALTELGQTAYESSFKGAGLQDQYDAINELKRSIGNLKKEPDISDDAGMAEKIKQKANKGKRALEIEGLLRKQKALFREIGEAIISIEEVPNELQQPLDNVQAQQRKIDELTNEIESLRSKVSGVFAKPGRVLAVIALVIMVFLAWNFVMPRYESWKAEKEMEKQMKIAEAEVQKQQKLAEAEMAKYEAETNRMQMESLQRRKQMEEEQRIADAQREKERLEQRLKREEEETARALAAERMAAERKLEEERRQAAAAAAEAEREARRAKEEEDARIAAAEAQVDRKALAEKLFAPIPLSPNVSLARSIKQSDASIEMRGENLALLQELHQKKDWLGLLSALAGRPLDEYPDARTIERASSSLLRSNYKILLRTRFQETNSSQLYMVKFPEQNRYSYGVMNSSSRWERHPDGIGYLHTWSPEDGPVIILVGNYNTAGTFLRETQQAYRNELSALKKKKDLGELTEDAVASSIEILRQRAHQAVSQWTATR